MISPWDICERARKLWLSGEPLRSTVDGSGDFFPCIISFRKPTAKEWLDSFTELRKAVESLESRSKLVCGSGYSISLREVAHQKLGRLRVPETIAFDSIDDLAACADKIETLKIFRHSVDLLRSIEPRLIAWLADYPHKALDNATRLPQLLAITKHFQANPRPNRFARELGIPGVDSKFIEDNRVVLSEWLDRLLPSESIESSVRGQADHGFERRYGLRFEEPLIRFRWLDCSKAPGGIDDAAIPLSNLMTYAPPCSRVIVTENKVNFLTLPECPDTLAIFGRGYAVDLLRHIPWLANRPLHYWGDLDTHGFSILNRLRQYVPHVQSLLMNRDTLMDHRDLWTEEPSDNRALYDLINLDPLEKALHDDLRNDRLGYCVRLEQERISYPHVQNTITALNSF